MDTNLVQLLYLTQSWWILEQVSRYWKVMSSYKSHVASNNRVITLIITCCKKESCVLLNSYSLCLCRHAATACCSCEFFIPNFPPTWGLLVWLRFKVGFKRVFFCFFNNFMSFAALSIITFDLLAPTPTPTSTSTIQPLWFALLWVWLLWNRSNVVSLGVQLKLKLLCMFGWSLPLRRFEVCFWVSSNHILLASTSICQSQVMCFKLLLLLHHWEWLSKLRTLEHARILLANGVVNEHAFMNYVSLSKNYSPH